MQEEARIGPLPMGKIIFGAVLTMLARTASPKRPDVHALSPWTYNFMNTLNNFKFLSYVDKERLSNGHSRPPNPGG